jgi:hypothetical protein
MRKRTKPLPEHGTTARRVSGPWKTTAVGVVVVAVVVAVVVILTHSSSSPTGHFAIDMSTATGVVCGPPSPPGRAHPDPLLAQIFTVPYNGDNRSYQFGTAGNILALETPAGGRPLGFGKGTVTFLGKATTGTLNAVVTLTTGGSLTVGGSWHCQSGAS